jgi:hypothetical protein
MFDYDFGGVVLSTLTSYNKGTQLLDADLDFTSQPDLILGNNIFGNFRAYLLTDLEDYSQEVRLRSDGDSRFFWLLGGYYRKETFRQQDLGPVGANGSSNILSTVPNRLNRDTETLGLFGYVGLELFPGFKITQELRYSEDRIDEASTPRATGVTGSFGTKFTNVLPRTIVEYAASKGVMFITIEDESDTANLIIWPALYEQQRRLILTASMIGVDGRVQREGEVLHVIALRLHDLSADLAGLGNRETFPLPHGRGDEFHHGSPPQDSRSRPPSPLNLKPRDFR